jgi:hypothetical protein
MAIEISAPPIYETTLAEVKDRDADGIALPISDFGLRAHNDRRWLLGCIAKLEKQREELMVLKDIKFEGEQCAKCATLETFILWCIARMKELEA